jgi:hypothetical protein
MKTSLQTLPPVWSRLPGKSYSSVTPNRFGWLITGHAQQLFGTSLP